MAFQVRISVSTAPLSSAGLLSTSARLLLLLAVTAVSLIVMTVSQGSEPDCSTDYGNYTEGSQYAENLNDLVGSLSNAAVMNGWSYNGTTGVAPDQVWGFIMCYADWSVTQCVDCLGKAAQGLANLTEICNYSHARNTSINYDGCLLQYMDAPFFDSAEIDYLLYWSSSPINAMNTSGMREARSQLLELLATRAGDHPLRLWNGSQNYTYGGLGAEQVTMYGFAQCARYLPSSECTRCLMNHVVAFISVRMNNSEAGYIKGFSCYTRFQAREPINITMPFMPPVSSWDEPPLPQVQPPLTIAPSSSGGSRTPLIVVLAVAAGTVMLVVVLSISVWALSMRL